MKISIITPSYNQGQYIGQAIDSVRRQNNQEIEHLIYDAKSTDNTKNILSKYPSSINFQWVSEIDKGQSEAINKGIVKSCGQVINWLNSDDYYEPHMAEVIDKNFSNPKINCLCARSRVFDKNGSLYVSKGTDIYRGNLAKTMGWARIDQPETFFRREVWEKVGPLNESLHYVMDREWWLRYLYRYGLEGIRSVDDVIVNFRHHDKSKSVEYSNNFALEHHSLFFLLARGHGDKNIISLIEKYNNIDESIESAISRWKDSDLIKKILNYYLLKTADEAFYFNKLPQSKSYLKYVNQKWLDSQGRALYYSLLFKTQVPHKIYNFLRNRNH